MTSSIEDEIQKAIEESVIAHGLDQQVAKKITNWFISIKTGNETIHDEEMVSKRMETILDTIYVSDEEIAD